MNFNSVYSQEYELLTDFIYTELEDDYFINEQGEVELLFIAFNGETWKLFDKNFIELFSTEGDIFHRICPFSNGLAAAHNGIKWGFINPKGDWVIEPKYRLMKECGFHDSLAVVAENCIVGAIDIEGNLLIDYQYNLLEHYSNYNFLWALNLKKKQGIINENGEVLIPCEYDNLEIKSQNVFKVTQQDSTFYINDKNETITDISQPRIPYSSVNIYPKKTMVYNPRTSNNAKIIEYIRTQNLKKGDFLYLSKKINGESRLAIGRVF